VLKGRRVPPERRARQVRQELPDLLARKAIQALAAFLAHRVPEVYRVSVVRKVIEAPPDLQAHPVQLALPVFLALPVGVWMPRLTPKLRAWLWMQKHR